MAEQMPCRVNVSTTLVTCCSFKKKSLGIRTRWSCCLSTFTIENDLHRIRTKVFFVVVFLFIIILFQVLKLYKQQQNQQGKTRSQNKKMESLTLEKQRLTCYMLLPLFWYWCAASFWASGCVDGHIARELKG